MPIQNALTVDVEDYYQVSGFESGIRREQWPSFPSRVVDNTRKVLKIFDDANVQGTFFILGWAAERHPELVREIDQAGHEIGSHSYWHRLVYELTPEQFRADLCQSRDILADIIGKPVKAYRAPSFSIVQKSLWALEILAEEGFTIDSSIFPIHHDRYGIPDAPQHPYCCDDKDGQLWEFPASAARLGGVNLPISGGGYFRFLPYRVSSSLLKRINVRQQLPFVFYIHPWEIDPEQPRLNVSGRLARFRHYVNLATTETKLVRLLDQFRFSRLDQVLQNYRSDVLAVEQESLAGKAVPA